MVDRPHAASTEAVLEALESDRSGLTADSARERLAEHGRNDITRRTSRTWPTVLVGQFDSVLIWVLVLAAGLSLAVGHGIDAVLIAAIVVANGIFGFVQDYRAERSLEALRELATPSATVLRDETPTTIPATEVVPGDVIQLSAGDVVPADARVLETADLSVDEGPLTGESLPVSKSADPVGDDRPLAERSSMVYKATSVTRGRGSAVVVATGMATELGVIAASLEGTDEADTPLQAELDTLGGRLGLGVIALSAVVAPVLVLGGTDLVQAALTAISLAVAAVPEGLPAIVTLTLSLGVRRMSEENALVRRLPAVEGLGGVDVVCTDKTGTLTRGEMTVRTCWVLDDRIEAGAASLDDPRMRSLVESAILCSDATADDGDPTEQALVRFATDRGLDVTAERDRSSRIDEAPFSSETKWMGTLHDDGGHVKGAPSVILDRCSHGLTTTGRQSLDDQDRADIAAAVDALADEALRVLAVARAPDATSTDDLEDGLTFVGLVGMMDPARAEVADAIAATERAGIEVKMITGDNARTAVAIADAIGLGDDLLEGGDIETMDDATLRERVEETAVFARTSPVHKQRILEALQANGHRVAMTGDGVNDAPALKNADIGVAMGIRGTDVAREAADIVLLDDNYATIERAVERGRAIYDNIWKFVAYLLSANIAEVLLVLLASLFGYLILPAVQLLWINLLTDGLPALAIGADPASDDVMDRPPRDPNRGIVGRGMLGLIGGLGLVTTAVMLGVMIITLGGAPSTTDYAMTMVFTGFVFVEFEKLYVIRWVRDTPTFANWWLVAAILASAALHLAILYTPLSTLFGTVSLGVADWGLLVVAMLVCLPGYAAIAWALRRAEAGTS